MTLNELCLWADGMVPEAEGVIPSISSTQLDKRRIFNEAASEFAKHTYCLREDAYFNAVANQQEYSIATNLPNFLMMREEGIWHYRTGSNTATWDRCEPVTVRELDDRYPSWRTSSSSDSVDYYWQDGNTLGFYYMPSTTATNGFRAYFYATSSDMSEVTHYPFTGTSTNDPRLNPYHKVLLVYYQAKALDILGYKADANNKLLEFYQLCDKAKSDMETRRDLAQESHMRPRSYMDHYRSAFR